MSLKHGLLGLLSYGDLTGYELTKAFEDSLAFFWQAQMSQVYRELKAMEKAGWLTSRAVIQTDKPNKRVYSITQQGREELRGWLEKDLSEDFFTTRSAFLMQLFFSEEKGKAATIASLKRARAACQATIEESKKIEDSIRFYRDAMDANQRAVYWNMTAQFGYAYYEMCGRWLDNCIQALEEATEEGGKEREGIGYKREPEGE